MPFIVEKKGDGPKPKFLVVNRDTGRQTGHFEKKDEAIDHAKSLNARDKEYRPKGEIFINGQ